MTTFDGLILCEVQTGSWPLRPICFNFMAAYINELCTRSGQSLTGLKTSTLMLTIPVFTYGSMSGNVSYNLWQLKITMFAGLSS